MHRTKPRAGMTLLEVIFAMAIFLISIVALYQLSNIGGERALDVSLQTRTMLRAQSKMAEIGVGAEPMNSSGGYTAFQDDLDKDFPLQWKMDVANVDQAELAKKVTVSVQAVLPSGKIVESQFTQIVIVPAARGTTFDQPDPAPQSESMPGN